MELKESHQSNCPVCADILASMKVRRRSCRDQSLGCCNTDGELCFVGGDSFCTKASSNHQSSNGTSNHGGWRPATQTQLTPFCQSIESKSSSGRQRSQDLKDTRLRKRTLPPAKARREEASTRTNCAPCSSSSPAHKSTIHPKATRNCKTIHHQEHNQPWLLQASSPR